MSDEVDLSDYEYVGVDPYSEKPDKVAIGSQGVRFVLQRVKKRRRTPYQAIYDIEWSEVVSFECCEVSYAKDEKSWPLDEEPREKLDIIGPAGMMFFFLMPKDEGVFQVWSYIPLEDVRHVRELVEKYAGKPQVPRLAHHGNAAVVRHILEHCTILSRHQTPWHDWIKTGPLLGKPRKKFTEKGPDYVFCKEGLVIDHYGSGEMLEQMSTFWPWRIIEHVFLDDYSIVYQWYDDGYVFRQQVWDNDQRKVLLDAAKDALAEYRRSEDADELLLIRPWAFPSYFYTTWEKLDPLSCKASRNGFPPVFDFVE